MCINQAMCMHLCLCYAILCACVYRRRLRDLYNLHKHSIQFQQYCIIVRRDIIGGNYSQSEQTKKNLITDNNIIIIIIIIIIP